MEGRRCTRPVVRCLASTDVRTRIGAIACLGFLPIDAFAAPAVPYLEDNDSVDVRRQTLVSFAQRPSLLTEDMLLKRLHDSDSEHPRDAPASSSRPAGSTRSRSAWAA